MSGASEPPLLQVHSMVRRTRGKGTGQDRRVPWVPVDQLPEDLVSSAGAAVRACRSGVPYSGSGWN